MTKQLNLDLAAALEDAQQGRDDGEMLIVRAGSAYMKVKAFNAGKHAASLRKIRAPRQRGELRTYPKFTRGMSTAEYVAKFAALNTNAEAMKNNRMPAYVLPFGHLNTAPCALYENGARDFDVIEEIDADDAQSVAAPEVQSAPAAAVDSLYNPGTPDPKNSAALPELGGFRPGDVVDVSGRTIGRSTIELVFLRKLAGFDAEPLARIVGASGKRLDVQLFQLTRVEAPAAEIVEQSPTVAALEEVSPPCGDIAPAAQDVAESKAAAPVEIEAADGAAAPEANPPCEGIAPASPEYVALRRAARDARAIAQAAIHKAQHSSTHKVRAAKRDAEREAAESASAPAEPAPMTAPEPANAPASPEFAMINSQRKKLKEQIQQSHQITPAIGPSLFSDQRTGSPVVVPNKATADAMARSRQLSGKVAVRKATPEEMADERNAFTGYNAGEGRRMGYVLEMLQPQRKERSGY